MPPELPVVVIGAGIAGVACARALVDAGVSVRLIDRGRRIGGRMASRSVTGRAVDTGASYFTAADADFSAVVDSWQRRGLARPWTDTFTVLGDPDKSLSSGPMRWGASRGLRALVEDLASGLAIDSDVTVSAVASHPDLRVDAEPARAVVLAMPDPQARRLLAPGTAAYDAVDRAYDPVLALITQWTERHWPQDFDGAFVNGDDVLGWIADDGRRRGDGAPVLVAHSTSAFAADRLEQPGEAAGPMTAALRHVLDIDAAPVSTLVQRWSFAKPARPREAAEYYLGADLIGICGDGWAAKPRVEGAYLSGRRLGEALVARLS